MMMKWSMSALQQEKMTQRDKLQGAMDDIGWNDKEKMDELMDTVLTQQPAAN
jgi:putative lysine transport system substrate-binding protein